MDKVFYLCDRRACEKCRYPECKHTSDINHAAGFIRDGYGVYSQSEFTAKIDCDGNIVLCLTGDDLPIAKDGEKIPFENVVSKTIYYDGKPKLTVSHIELYKHG